MPKRQRVTYLYVSNKLDTLGLNYHLLVDSWENGYTYHGYSILCEFHNVEPTSEVIFDNLTELLDERFFKLY